MHLLRRGIALGAEVLWGGHPALALGIAIHEAKPQNSRLWLCGCFGTQHLAGGSMGVADQLFRCRGIRDRAGFPQEAVLNWGSVEQYTLIKEG